MELTLELEPKLEAVLKEHCRIHQTTPEAAVLRVLKNRYMPFEPRDDWEVRLLALALDTGAVPTPSAFEREENYD